MQPDSGIRPSGSSLSFWNNGDGTFPPYHKNSYICGNPSQSRFYESLKMHIPAIPACLHPGFFALRIVRRRIDWFRREGELNLSDNLQYINTLLFPLNRNTPNRPQHTCSYFPLNPPGYHKFTNIFRNLQLK